MNRQYGWSGKILFIDLSNGTTRVEPQINIVHLLVAAGLTSGYSLTW